MTREEFIEKCNHVVRNYRNVEEFNKCINQILDSGCIDLDNVQQDYTPAFWVVGALFSGQPTSASMGAFTKKSEEKTVGNRQILRSSFRGGFYKPKRLSPVESASIT